jgi:histidinol dehydrogenase
VLNRLDLRGRPDPTSDLPRPVVAGDEPVAVVREIITAVAERGDAAVAEYSRRFDGVVADPLRVPGAALAAALDAQPTEVRTALEFAAESISGFHAGQVRAAHVVETDGLTVEARAVPVDRAGLYVPGGRAAYPSTVLMTALPALAAGVAQVALCVPPGPTGEIAAVTLAAAKVAGVTEVYAVGGAQAVAAMAYGTEAIPAVDVIAGPGNVYVAVAKREVAGVVGVPSAFAGPSEIVVIADGSAPAEYAAIDLIVQAEHGPHGLAWLITSDERVADAVTAEVDRLVAESPRRSDIEATLASSGYAVIVDDAAAAVDVANRIAPEHLQLLTESPRDLLPLVRHAGAVFCGPLSPASIGDYVAGPSHVLPTNGTARFAGALTTSDFTKDVHVITVDSRAFERLAPHVEVLARAEGLAAHAESVALRRGSGS